MGQLYQNELRMNEALDATDCSNRSSPASRIMKLGIL